MLAIGALGTPTLAAQRALVIGIDDYAHISRLSRAVGDAKAMSAELTQLGFAVTTVLDPDRRQINEAITTFRLALQPGDVALVHFSGHGVGVNNQDLLLPRDIPRPEAGQEDYLVGEAINLNSLMDRVSQSGATVRIFVIDACRDNPFATSQSRGLGQSRGLSIVQPPRGSFILYSAGYGQTALDGLGPDDASPTSLYTRVLLESLRTPGLGISQIARDVRSKVAALAGAIGHQQEPAYYDALTDDFYLQPRPAGQKLQLDVETAAFEAARSIATPAAWKAFLENFPTSVFADLARAALSEIDPDTSRQVAAIDEFAARGTLETLWADGGERALHGDLAGSYRSLDDARRLALEKFGDDSVEYAEASNRIVGALTSIGRMADAIAASREAIRIFTAKYGASDSRVLNEKGNLAARLAATGEKEEADALYALLFESYGARPLSGHDALSYAHLLEGYAQLKGDAGDVTAALDYADRAIMSIESAGQTATIDYGWIIATKGYILRQAGRCDAAATVFAKAREAMKRAGVAESHPDHAAIIRLSGTGC